MRVRKNTVSIPTIPTFLKFSPCCGTGRFFHPGVWLILSDAHALKAAEVKAFKEYISSPSPDAVLIFTTDETPGTRDYPRSLADVIPKDSIQVFWELFEKDKRSWVMGFFRERALRVDADAIDLLLDVTEGTTDALREACEMLSFSARTGSSISEDDVDRVLEHGRNETVYSLFDRFCRRDLSTVLEAYRKIVHSDPSAADRLLSMFVDPLVRLRDFATLVKRGATIESAAKDVRLRGGKRAVRAYSEGINRYSERELDTAVSGLADLEAWLRTAPRRTSRTENRALVLPDNRNNVLIGSTLSPVPAN